MSGTGEPLSLEKRRELSQAGQEKWGFDAKNVPQHVKNLVATLPKVVREQYEITFTNMAAESASKNTGDGVLQYLGGWNHKRFGGQYCLLYRWQVRLDNQGFFLAVQGLGRKNGNGNDYDLL